MTSSDDSELVRRMVGGEQTAFNEFFDTYADRLYRFAMKRLGDDPDSAEDAVQMTLCRAVEKIAQFKGEAALFTWLCTICRNTIVDIRRSSGLRQFDSVPFEDSDEIRVALEALSSSGGTDPQEGAFSQQMEAVVSSILDYLPGRYGDVLEWKYMHGLSVREISVRLGVSTKAAESALNRARIAFRDGVIALGNTETVQAGLNQ